MRGAKNFGRNHARIAAQFRDRQGHMLVAINSLKCINILWEWVHNYEFCFRYLRFLSRKNCEQLWRGEPSRLRDSDDSVANAEE